MDKLIKYALEEISKLYVEEHVISVLPVDKICDPSCDLIVNLEEGEQYKGKSWFMREYRPIYVHIPNCDNLRLYFFVNGDFDEWLLDYLIVTGDKEFKDINVFNMFNDKMIDRYNNYQLEERTKNGEPPLGDYIVEGCSAINVLGQEWKIVPRKTKVRVEINY